MTFTAKGTLPYNHKFKQGYSKDSSRSREEGFSYISRTNRLRKTFLDGEFIIDPERAMLVTEAYKMFEAEPINIKRAKTLKHILDNCTIYTYDEEIIVGNACASNKHAAIYPEFSYDWIIDEMENFPFENRECDSFIISEDTKDKLRSISDYWKGRTVESRVTNNLTDAEKAASNLGIGSYLLNLYHVGGIGHYVFNYERLLEIGFVGFVEIIKNRLAEVKIDTQEGVEQRNELTAMLISMEATINYIKRYAEAYEEKAKSELDNNIKAEYEQIANNLRALTLRAPENFWEAVQAVHIGTTVTLIESNGHSISYGRMDQYLYPFYKKDLDSGNFSQEFMQEIIEAHYIKLGTTTKLRDRMTAMANSGRGFGGESLTLGGVKRDGSDATNDLTLMMLDATAHTRMMTPWTCVRFHENTPHELKVKTFEVIKGGCGHPKIFNDQAAIPPQLKLGRTIEEARDYAVVGCVEISNPGLEFGWHDAAYMNILSVFELAINDGISLLNGQRIGIPTGSLENFKNIEEVKEAYDKQMEYITTQMVAGINIMEIAHKELAPTPYASIYFDNCIESGKDMMNGGCKYNHCGPQGTGIASVADSLANIDQIVFKDGKATGKEMLDALKANWEGYEKLYSLVNSSKLKHFGNDDDYADEFAVFAFNTYCKHIEERQSTRGGKYKPGVYGVSSNVAFGLISAASLDGRKAQEPISDNMSPVHTVASSHDTEGPTAIANSVTKMDHRRASNGTLLNWKFNPSNVSGETGTENLIKLLDEYFNKKGMHSQFNIMSSDTMRAAMEKPEQYRDMLVRVAGYSAYFVELSVPLQLDLVNRTELSFE